jgi:hypothetical protein
MPEGWMFRERLPDFPRFSIMTEWKDGEPKSDKRVHKDPELSGFSISNAVVMRFGVLNRNVGTHLMVPGRPFTRIEAIPQNNSNCTLSRKNEELDINYAFNFAEL